MPRADAQTATRERLITAAAEEIAAVGWDAARTRSVAARAGVNPGVVHYHFDSMEALLLEAAGRAMMTAVAGPAMAILAGSRLVDAVAESLRLFCQMDVTGVEGRILVEIMVQAGRRPDVARMVSEALAGYREAVMERVRRDVAAGALPPGTDPEGMAQLVAALLDGAALHRYVDPEADFGPLLETTIRLLGRDA